MKDELFRKTEGRLYRYYKQLRIIENLKGKVELLQSQKEIIKKEKQELKNLNIDTETNMGIDYSKERIQSSKNVSSVAETETIKYIDKLEKEYNYVVRKILKINARIRETELQIQDIQYNLNMLDEESKRFIEWKYAENKSINFIAIEMYGGARSTVYRKREELIEDIAQWTNIIK